MSSLLNLNYTFTFGTRYLIDLGFICIEEWIVNDNLRLADPKPTPDLKSTLCMITMYEPKNLNHMLAQIMLSLLSIPTLTLCYSIMSLVTLIFYCQACMLTMSTSLVSRVATCMILGRLECTWGSRIIS